MQIHGKTTIEILPDKISAITDTPTGPVGLHTQHVASVILGAAIQRVGDTYSGHHPGRGQRIKDSGYVVNIGGSSWAVEFIHPIAFLHHEGGSGNYEMPAKDEGSFYFRNGPGIVTSWGDTRFRHRGPINHPPPRANPFLTDSADSLGLRRSGALQRGTRPTKLFRLVQP